MKPRSISETQRVRALSLGLAVPPREPVVFTTSLGCRVETTQTDAGTEITLSGPADLFRKAVESSLS